MDTSIRIIDRLGKEVWCGASHFGYENLTLRGVSILIRLVTNQTVSMEDFDFVKNNLFIYEPKKDECPDVVIDNKNETVSFLNGFDFRKLEDYKDLDLTHIERVNFDRVDLFTKLNLTYEEFFELYEFIKTIDYKTKVLINSKFIYYFN